MNKRKKWFPQEVEYLNLLWGDGKKTKEITTLLGRHSWDSIRRKANEIGLKSDGRVNRRTATKSEKLLDGSPESLYWIGFLLGDGHFTKAGYIKLGLAKKDLKHLKKFADFIGLPHDKIRITTKGLHEISFCNKKVHNRLTEKFNISNRKTTKPFNLPNDMSVLEKRVVGYGLVDADGTIGYQTGRKDCYLSVLGDASCKVFLQDILDAFQMVLPTSYYYTVQNKQQKNYNGDIKTYVYFRITRNSIIKDMKKECMFLELPVMGRKWDKI